MEKLIKTYIVFFVVALVLVVGVTMWSNSTYKHDKDLLQTVQNADIGGGITLREGIRAYCGRGGKWYIESGNTVRVVGYIGQSTIEATLEANTKSGEVKILEFRYDGNVLDGSDTDAVIADMVQAAIR